MAGVEPAISGLLTKALDRVATPIPVFFSKVLFIMRLQGVTYEPTLIMVLAKSAVRVSKIVIHPDWFLIILSSSREFKCGIRLILSDS